MNTLIFLLLLIGALLYLILPTDLVPDFLLGWGWLDDLFVVYLLWRYYRRLSQPRQTGEAADESRNAGGRGQQRNAGTDHRAQTDPYTVLELSPGATRTEIKAAYRRLAAKYHPDKVLHLGREFQELAEARFKAIQQAYDTLMRK